MKVTDKDFFAILKVQLSLLVESRVSNEERLWILELYWPFDAPTYTKSEKYVKTIKIVGKQKNSAKKPWAISSLHKNDLLINMFVPLVQK